MTATVTSLAVERARRSRPEGAARAERPGAPTSTDYRLAPIAPERIDAGVVQLADILLALENAPLFPPTVAVIRRMDGAWAVMVRAGDRGGAVAPEDAGALALCLRMDPPYPGALADADRIDAAADLAARRNQMRAPIVAPPTDRVTGRVGRDLLILALLATWGLHLVTAILGAGQ